MASQLTHKVGVLYSSDAGTIANTTETFTGHSEVNLNEDVPGATTDHSIPAQVTPANIVSMCLFSSKITLTVKTYASAVLKDTLTLVGGRQIQWNTDHVEVCPFTVPFDTVKVTNADPTVATQFRASILLLAAP